MNENPYASTFFGLDEPPHSAEATSEPRMLSVAYVLAAYLHESWWMFTSDDIWNYWTHRGPVHLSFTVFAAVWTGWLLMRVAGRGLGSRRRIACRVCGGLVFSLSPYLFVPFLKDLFPFTPRSGLFLFFLLMFLGSATALAFEFGLRRAVALRR